MVWEVWLWLICFFISISLLGVLVYQLICLSDLEYDYINPYDSSSRINAIIMPEFVTQGVLSALFLLTWHWFMFLLMAPVTYYHIKLYLARRHLVDVTEIFRLLNGEKKYRMVKLAFYLTLFFVVMFRLVGAAVTAILDEDDGLQSELFK
ncbi:protein cornichon homolog 4 [Amborella trichopoda]|uniref:protein cornichon homolog 4 n=1 Tax=Amborella trichopoda TaxID=13333 RepID=UPI0005D43B91|nr:protein cornichon homolog 4 [Amborella trichopoda]|eukprot:XP_011625461.1 protein cornichon homolog 4 [Amborella trichopoda]